MVIETRGNGFLYNAKSKEVHVGIVSDPTKD